MTDIKIYIATFLTGLVLVWTGSCGQKMVSSPEIVADKTNTSTFEFQGDTYSCNWSYVEEEVLQKNQWYLDNIDARGAWQYINFSGAPRIRIAVLENNKISTSRNYLVNLAKSSYVAEVSSVEYKIREDTENPYTTFDDVKRVMNIPENNKSGVNQPFIQDNKQRLVALGKITRGSKDTAEVLSIKMAGGYLSPLQQADHPTNVAGLIAGRHDEIGIQGICPFAEITSLYLDIVDERIKMEDTAYLSPISNFLRFAAPDIINASLEFDTTVDNNIYQEEMRAWDRLARKDSLGKKRSKKTGQVLSAPIIVSAGNNKKNIENRLVLSLPFIAVGATKKDNSIASSYCNRARTLKLYAPGGIDWKPGQYRDIESIVTTSFFAPPLFESGKKEWEGGWTLDFSGTSASAPIVSGVTGLVLAVNPNLDRKELKSLLLRSGKPCKGESGDKRLVNAKGAVQEAFLSIVTAWRKYWSGKQLIGFKAYYDKGSLVVRGRKKDDRVCYRIFSDRELTLDEMKNEVVSFVAERHEGDLPYDIDTNVYPLADLIRRTASLNEIYDDIRIFLELSCEDITPETAYIGQIKDGQIIDRMEVSFVQKFEGQAENRVLYRDRGEKFLHLERKRETPLQSGEWVIKKEIWVYNEGGDNVI